MAWAPGTRESTRENVGADGDDSDGRDRGAGGIWPTGWMERYKDEKLMANVAHLSSA